MIRVILISYAVIAIFISRIIHIRRHFIVKFYILRKLHTLYCISLVKITQKLKTEFEDAALFFFFVLLYILNHV